MTYRRDPQKRLAELLHIALNKGHLYAVIEPATSRLVMSGREERLMKAFAGWAPGTQLINVRQHIEQLPRVTC